ncbi:DnaB-like helicase C-terminal domain-containing protein [Streptomyces sp. NPDC006632]|uniref:DnaB-like helicase C-terminal domain-containing protein n=1 Tax=Streptomyces sp. NPDC006632 TaxID=3157182 RepID=UPI0033A95D6B
MSSIEEEVISYVALTGDLDTVVGQAGGITAEHFLDPETRKVFSSILAFKADFGEPPTPEVILRDHPNFVFTEDSSGPIDYLLRELHESRRRTIIDLGMGAVGEALDKGGSEAAMPLLRMMLAQATTATAGSREIDYAATGAQRLDIYRQARDNPGELLGIPTGFRFLDQVTLGIQPQQMIVLTGLAKSCKTTVMLGMTRSAYDYGAKPLLVSFEMPYGEIARRLDGFLAKVNPRKLQTGQLSAKEWRQLEAALTDPLGEQPYVVTEDRAGAMTISGLQTKVDQLAPSVLFVDGAYFLFDEISRESQTPIAMTNISRGLKKLALNNDIPVVVTTQSLSHKVGAKGLTVNSLGYTSAWGQDADLVVGMEATDEETFYRLKVLASRNAPPQEHIISISWEPPSFEEAEIEADLPY